MVCCIFVVGGKRFGCLVVGGDWLVERPYCVYIAMGCSRGWLLVWGAEKVGKCALGEVALSRK